ncbi:MAG: Na/Pi cotransporter family protein [Lachnospiraceae bacterium]|nr:Na/Pi cotransporter family protein [Lachnospiraceae bacterium]
MTIFDVLNAISGLALFLFGMHLLGDGLAKMSGGKLEQFLEKLTNTPLKAVLVGMGVTAVIQSSSATTVMVVGFVNSGIMKLQQAVGIIMGANIGTTVTSWILGLAGIEDTSLFLKLCKPSSFGPILAIVGVAIIMFSKRDKLKNTAMILIGFTILMNGMDTMSNAVKPLRDVPEFTNILVKFSNPLLGLLAGIILTAVIQSSSASVGILQALCLTGAVGYNTALPIIMGQNIGTCVTAMISSVGASKNAKRASLIHLYFNLIGTFLFMIAFYVIHAVRPFAFMEQAATPFGIATVHSIFNIVATLVLLPFSKGLVKLATISVREDQEQESTDEAMAPLQYLEPRFMEMPSLAIDRSKAAAMAMARLTRDTFDMAVELMHGYDSAKAERVTELEGIIDKYEDQIGNYLVKLNPGDMTNADSHLMTTVLHCIGDFERISDHARNLMEAAREMYEKQIAFSEGAMKEVEVYVGAVRESLDLTVQSFCENDTALASLVEPLEEVVDALNLEVKARHISRLKQGNCTIELGFVLSDISTNLERVSDHCSNVAIAVLQQMRGNEFDAHHYLEYLKQENNTEFRNNVMKYKEKYQMP